ncbi:MAG: DUF2062 domain-containing protein [Gammaproteobacteria bacterium]
MSPRHLLKRYLVSRENFAHARGLGWLGTRLHDPELWHLGRRSVAGGVGLGFFLAFIPLPVQMLIGGVLAFLFRVNLPVTMAAIWLTNPLTMAPMFLFAYKVGSWISGYTHANAPAPGHFEPSFSGVIATFGDIWQPLLLGCFVCGLSAAAIGNLAVRWLWRGYLLYRRREKRLARVRRLPRDDRR